MKAAHHNLDNCQKMEACISVLIIYLRIMLLMKMPIKMML
jgi:hypothetical protein